MAKSSDYCVCKYKHCLHPDNKPFPKIDAVKVGSVFYHKDCYELKNTIAEIIDYFTKEVNPDVVHMILVKTINNIVFPKGKPGVPAERLLFQLKYRNTHGGKGKIHYPAGLYYVLQDRESFEAYRKYKAEKALKNEDTSFKIGDAQNGKEPERKIRLPKQKSFEDIICG